ncbi:hypothetical protein GIB67_032324 [Kingdonia uniflora]|uniref:Uncharacterized protein n=1 Tax=Kingdonia uniflora TaxID=39325 RepID=A0A7J7MXE6_9MAGN|nr:hypothetical protein GIB67_032324 [Kingdonia uniflora]
MTLISPKTTYVAYFIYKLREDAKGFDQTPVHVLISFIEIKGCQKSRSVYLDTNNAVRSRKREDGWLRIEMGEFFKDAGEDGAINIILKDMNKGDSKSGLIIQGIELWPKHGSTPETLIAKKVYMIKATELKYLDVENPKCWHQVPPQIREDGWLEIKMGEFVNSEGEDGVVRMVLGEMKRHDSKSGLVI